MGNDRDGLADGGPHEPLKTVFEGLKQKTGSNKKAIVAVARRLLGVMFSLLRSGQAYRLAV